MTVPNITQGNTLWALTDHLRSVRDLVDNNGVIREHNVYDSFGRLVREVDYNTAGQLIASTDPAAVDTLFGYTSRLFDQHTGLQYYRARWCDATTGRWLSQDPFGFAAGDANLYRYVGNGTAMATDPSGLREFEVVNYYCFETLDVNNAVKKEVQRILEARLKRGQALIPRPLLPGVPERRGDRSSYKRSTLILQYGATTQSPGPLFS